MKKAKRSLSRTQSGKVRPLDETTLRVGLLEISLNEYGEDFYAEIENLALRHGVKKTPLASPAALTFFNASLKFITCIHKGKSPAFLRFATQLASYVISKAVAINRKGNPDYGEIAQEAFELLSQTLNLLSAPLSAPLPDETKSQEQKNHDLQIRRVVRQKMVYIQYRVLVRLLETKFGTAQIEACFVEDCQKLALCKPSKDFVDVMVNLAEDASAHALSRQLIQRTYQSCVANPALSPEQAQSINTSIVKRSSHLQEFAHKNCYAARAPQSKAPAATSKIIAWKVPTSALSRAACGRVAPTDTSHRPTQIFPRVGANPTLH